MMLHIAGRHHYERAHRTLRVYTFRKSTRVYPKYWDTYIHTILVLKFETPVDVIKIMLSIWQTEQTLIRRRVLCHLIWVLTVYKALSVPILRLIKVILSHICLPSDPLIRLPCVGHDGCIHTHHTFRRPC